MTNVLTGLDLRMKEIGVNRLGQEVMDKLTDEELITARCDTFRFLNEIALTCAPLEEGAIEFYFCEVFVKDIIERKEVKMNGKAEGAH